VELNLRPSVEDLIDVPEVARHIGNMASAWELAGQDCPRVLRCVGDWHVAEKPEIQGESTKSLAASRGNSLPPSPRAPSLLLKNSAQAEKEEGSGKIYRPGCASGKFVRKRATAELLSEAKKSSITKILQTCPGLGPIRVAELVSIVVTPERFCSKR